MQTNETPQTLKDNLLTTHVRDRVNQTNAVECELNEVTFVGHRVQIVACQRLSVLDFGEVWL